MKAESAPLFAQVADVSAALGYSYAKTLGAKTLPLLLLACAPRREHAALALLWLSALLAALLLTLRFASPALGAALVVVPATLAYYALVCCLVAWLARRQQVAALRGDVLFAVLALASVFVPAWPLRRLGGLELLVIGWAIALSGYSYCCEARSGRLTPGFRQALFFLLIDPVFSYPERSRPAPVLPAFVLKRAALATVMVIAGDQLLRHLHLIHPPLEALLGKGAGRGVAKLLALPAVFLSVYWVRAGAAHLRIGMMRTIGFGTPECYRRPYLAASPLDFWRRWNCWVGAWVRRYLFIPLSLKLLRARSSSSAAWHERTAKAVAVLASFLIMGLLHDWLIFTAQGASTLVFTKTFGFGALGLLVWEGVRIGAREERGAWRAGRIAYAAAYVSGMLWISGVV